MTWAKTAREVIPWWRVYVHDLHEQVLLPSYGMVDLPYITLNKQANLMHMFMWLILVAQ